MPDPSSLVGMDKAAERIARAIRNEERMAVFGDYDVDGAVSAALWKLFLRAHGQDCHVHIPDRDNEGYGPNPQIMRSMAEDGARLIMTVDCGSGQGSGEALGAASEAGADVVVFDHHQPGAAEPPCLAHVNPNQSADKSGMGELAAAGVVFLALVAVRRELRESGYYDERGVVPPDLMQFLDLAALATICDVVPLSNHLNRAFVRRGLEIMARGGNIGLRALAREAGLTGAPDSHHLGYVLGPRINAAGRIGDSSLGVRLLSCEDEGEAGELAKRLEQYNRRRRDMEGEMLEEALARAERQLENEPDLPLLVVGSKDWRRGLVGLLAGRLCERFSLPAIAIAWEGEEGAGSARSVAGVDIGAAIREAVERGLLARGGGHAMAAGLTVLREKSDELTFFLQERISAMRDRGERQAPELIIDGAITPLAANEALLNGLERIGPFGNGNPAPCMALPAVRVSYCNIVGNGHVRCTLQAGDGSSIGAIAFGAADTELGELLMDNSRPVIHVAGALKRNEWRGRVSVEMQIRDAAAAHQGRRRGA
jgi:single-stranded-DNA-specific exonuclease